MEKLAGNRFIQLESVHMTGFKCYKSEEIVGPFHSSLTWYE